MTTQATAVGPVRPVKEYFDYINQRHRIYDRRVVQQLLPPWTDDPVLRQWSFTNVWRDLDRGTMFLHEKILQPHADESLDKIFFNVLFHRQFNRWQTSEQIGWINTWEPKRYAQRLHALPRPVFTAAHIVRGMDGRSKIDSAVDILSNVWNSRRQMIALARQTKSMQAVFKEICEFPYLGQFMAYQHVLDLVQTRVLDYATDRFYWACTGPGALRGLRWLYGGQVTLGNGLEYMHDLLDKAPKYLSPLVSNFHLPFTIHEVEFALCEFSKLCRLRYAGGKSKVGFDERAYVPLV